MASTNSALSAISFLRTVEGPDSAAQLIKTPEFAEWLLSYLDEGEARVTFTKKDGEVRTMHCTRDYNLIPKDKQPKGLREEKTGTSLAVFDLEKGDWRSFIVANMTRIEFVEKV